MSAQPTQDLDGVSVPVLPRHLPLVVGTKEAARMLYCGETAIAAFVAAGLLMQHPTISGARRRAFAVRELERFASVGMSQTETGVMRIVP
jgi:hypothetical protein